MASAPTVTVNIRRIAFGGAGVGEVVAQHDHGTELLGITAFVPFTAPGERVRATVIEHKKRFIQAELVTIEQEGRERTTPCCPHFGTCGGCELQHLSYEAQLAAKYEMIRGSLAAAKLSSDVIARLHPVERGEPYGYRRRVTLHVDRASKIGFYRQNSRSVVAVDACPISAEAINDVLRSMHDLNTELGGKISSLVLESDRAGCVAVLKSPYALAAPERAAVLEKAKRFFQNVVLFAGGDEVGGFGRKIVEVPLNDAGTLALRVGAGNFSQVNIEVNIALIKNVIEEAGISRGALALDLYAGAGNFSLPLAKAGARVTAVESERSLIEVGRQNALQYKLERNLTFVHSSVERFLQTRAEESVDLIVADPPRSGLGPLASSLSFAKRFILISCHLPSFIRDLKTLLGEGYTLKLIKPFDMFAQTSYVETVSVLEKT
jgi:23S rRNA (uracil1939-C5)-methyltransferase